MPIDLRSYPRPRDDNGIGIHFRLDLAQTDKKPHISDGVQWLQQIHAKWTLVAGQDWNQIGTAAAAIWEAGIMPVCRLICRVNGPYIDWAGGVKTLQKLNIPPYIQIFNEPGDSREWKDGTHPDIPVFGGKWAEAAARVYDAGGYPGMGAVLGQDEWLAAFNAVKANNRMDIWNRAWFSVHNYGSNHPIDYPYDDVNQKGTPVTPAEYAQLKFSLPIDQLNAKRATDAHPGATLATDSTCVLRFLEFKAWMVESLGFCLPMIGGEGGWEWGNEEDLRYSKLTPEQHANNHRALFEWFCTGVLSNGDPLPDELFSLAPWIMADWGADDWWYGTLGTKQGTIDAVASIPPFVRKFSWDMPAVPSDGGASAAPGGSVSPTPAPGGSVTPTPVTPNPPASSGTGDSAPTPVTPNPPASSGTGETAPTPTAPNPPTVIYTVTQGETLWGISRKFGTTVDAIVQANNISDPSKIRAGQKIIIPR